MITPLSAACDATTSVSPDIFGPISLIRTLTSSILSFPEDLDATKKLAPYRVDHTPSISTLPLYSDDTTNLTT